jgi:predicted protein tyrosine phosphatase
MSWIVVTPLSALPDSIRRYRPSRVVTLLSPEHMIATPEGFADEHHLKLPVNDIAEAWAGEAPPAEVHVQALLTFGRAWTVDAPIIVHCWAGISRSMAAAYTILCDRMGPGHELAIAQEIRSRAPHADPNRLIVRLADEMLGRDGRMIEAVESIGRGVLVTEGVPVELPLVLPPRVASSR